jgi:hypothetical protein
MPVFKVILLATVLLAIALAALAIKIIVKKNGKFPDTDAGSNKNLKKHGIKCAKHEDYVHHSPGGEDHSCSPSALS